MQRYEWQEQAMALARKVGSIALFADPGLGKTRCAVDILREDFNTSKRVAKTLIFGPQAVLYNWKEEILKWSKIPKECIFVSGGTGKKRVTDLRTAINMAKIIVINYEALRSTDIYEALAEWRPELMICDESHKLKSHKSQQSKLVYSLSHDNRKRFILTGTPILNNPIDIFMQFKILDGGQTFGKNYYVFLNKYFMDANMAWKARSGYFPKWIPRPELFPELTAKIYTRAIRAKKEDCLDLPPLIRDVRKVSLSPLQRRMYDQMKKDFITYVDENEEKGAVVATLAMTKALRLLQICSGHVVDENHTVTDLGENEKLSVLADLVEQVKDNHKFIIWTCFRHDVTLISKMLTKMGVHFATLTGSQNAREKQDAIHEFETDAACRGILANRSAGGVGVNLIQASYSFVYSRNFSLEAEIQSEARNYRGGSQIHTSITKVDLVVRDSIEEHVLDCLFNKENISRKIIDLVKNS